MNAKGDTLCSNRGAAEDASAALVTPKSLILKVVSNGIQGSWVLLEMGILWHVLNERLGEVQKPTVLDPGPRLSSHGSS